MPYLLFAFAAGSFSSALWPALPPPALHWLTLLAAIPALPVARHWPRCRPIVWLAAGLWCGVAWAALWGEARLEARLPAVLDKSDWLVSGEVVGLPDRDRRRLRFELRVLDLKPLAPVGRVPSLRRLRLSWYGPAPEVRPGQHWRLRVRLRHPRGFANPGGFDYAAWLFSRGISATGYVRDHPQNVLRGEAGGWSIDAFRWRVAEHIAGLSLPAPVRGLLRALTVGDGSALSGTDWTRLRAAGVLHLAVISGLHIGLAAGFGMLLGSLAGRLLLVLGARVPARHCGALTAWLSGGFYALLAGFGLAAARAFAMLSVLLAVYLLRRRAARMAGFLWALAAIALLQPLAPLSPGFWLSFGAVAVLLAYFGSRPGGGWLSATVRAQWVVPLGTSVGLLWFQGQIPLLAPLVNLLAVPWVGMLAVPAGLVGVVLLPVAPTLADVAWHLAGAVLQVFHLVLAALETTTGAWRWQPAAGVRAEVLVLLVVVGLCLLGPPGLGLRRYALIALAAVALAGVPPRPPLQVTVLDVGQGLAVVVETAHHVLVYDTGPALSERFDAGAAIIAPYLRRRGWSRLDALVVSHEDLDHAGGAVGLAREYPPRREWRGGKEGAYQDAGITPCRAGQHWRWDGVGFHILHPRGDEVRENDRSCVLLVETGQVRVLLPGDIEAGAEARLLAAGVAPEAVTLLVAPHHGSATSSSPQFVARVRPGHVVYAAGYHHHFGHPHAAVVARYRALGARAWHTAAEGALRFVWWDPMRPAAVEVFAARRARRHYWDGG